MIELPKQKEWKTMRQVKEDHFWSAFNACKGDIMKTARLIKIGRASVYRYLAKGRKNE